MLKILAIDDKNDNLISFEALIKDCFPSAKVFTSLDGQSGFEMAKIHKPDVIVLDIIMPVLDGYQTCKLLKSNKKTKNIPVVFFTALKDDPNNRIKALEVGGEAFLSKPIDVSELKAQISAMAKLKKAHDKELDEKKKLKKAVARKTAELRNELKVRKKAEKQIRESETEKYTILQTAIDGFLILDKSGKILDINYRASRMVGYTKEEMINRRIQDFETNVDPIVRRNHLKDLIIKGGGRYESQIKTKDGSIIYVDVSTTKHKKEHKYYTFIRDVTKRRLSEEALKFSELKFRKVFENDSAIKLILEPNTGKIIDANQAAAWFYGWSKNELKKMNLNDLTYFDSIETSALNVDTKLNYDFRHQLKNGNIRDVELYISRVQVEEDDILHCIVHDITEKKEAEKRLILLRKAIEQSPVMVMITDCDGKIEYVNEKFSEITGFSYAEIVGKTPQVLKSGTQDEKFYNKLWSEILNGNDWQGELLNKKKSGETYWENELISPIVNGHNKITHFVAVKEDISDKKEMLSKLIDAKNKAEESDRLKSAFLANMSHEIRTPMNGILGFIELLQNPEISSNTQSTYLNLVKKSSEQLLNTINDIIEISKIESAQAPMHCSEINIRELIEYFYGFFEPEANKKGVSLLVELNDINDSCVIYTDRNKLESIITNLLKNALKFTSKGLIMLGVKKADDNYLHIYVRDTGKGIPDEKLETIFDRFVQVESAYIREFEGSGLGLSITKAYVEMLNGKIWVESKLGEGSTFHVHIKCRKK